MPASEVGSPTGAVAGEIEGRRVRMPRRVISEEETLEGSVIGDILQKLREEHSPAEKPSRSPHGRMRRLYRVIRRSESAGTTKRNVNPARRTASSVPDSSSPAKASEKSVAKEYKLVSYILRVLSKKGAGNE